MSSMLKHYIGIKHWWQIPLELTLRGGLVGGTLNPVFLLLPLSLIASAHAQGRRLLLAALIFAVPAWLNTGSRFLIPSAPFAAMALGIALETCPPRCRSSALFAAFVCWPPVLSAYCDRGTGGSANSPCAKPCVWNQLRHISSQDQPDVGFASGAIDIHVPVGRANLLLRGPSPGLSRPRYRGQL